MNEIRWALSICSALVVMMPAPVLGQFKEAHEPPGYLLEWGGSGSGAGQFGSPFGVAVDDFGNVYVADNGNNRIQKFDSEGVYVTEWGGSGTGDGQFIGPQGVATDASGNVYVSDYGNNRIQKFDSHGTYITQWGISGGGPGQFNLPNGVSADAFGNVYVADRSNVRIQKFDSKGSFLTEWGTWGSGAGQFNFVEDVAVDSAGNVYVADGFANHRIQKFDSNGNYLTEWGGLGVGPGQFSYPYAVAVDSLGFVYVADSGNNRVQKFDSAGNYLTEWGGSGTGPGQFNSLGGVAVDASGNVYVVGTDNHRIQKFAPSLWFDVAGYDSYLSVATLHETTAVRTLFQLENNGAPRFAFKNSNSDIEWSFQQSGPGNFLISREGTGGPEMQVYQNGRVRMGPGGAANFDLTPTGHLTITGSVTASGSVFPDYVFEPGYLLTPLEDVAAFFRLERRLPGIPSAEEVQQTGGHNMTELQLKLLEKIEEMTLYTLEHHERLNENDSEVRQLQAEMSRLKKLFDSERRSK